MCGRFTLRTKPQKLAEELGLYEVPVWEPRYNVAPTQSVLAVRLEGDDRHRSAVPMRWGLIPSWADDKAIGNRMINARGESVAEKPAFRNAFKHRRCLVVADGFYEWAKVPGGKQPYFFQLPGGKPFAFAGLWDRWTKGDEPIESCTLLTTDANAVVGKVHNRMPVILTPSDYDRWLDPAPQSVQALQDLLRPLPDDALEAQPVNRWVNDPTHDDAHCIDPAG